MVVVPWYGGGRCGRGDSNVDQDGMVVMEFDLVVVNACGANFNKYDNVDYLRENPAFQLARDGEKERKTRSQDQHDYRQIEGKYKTDIMRTRTGT